MSYVFQPNFMVNNVHLNHCNKMYSVSQQAEREGMRERERERLFVRKWTTIKRFKIKYFTYSMLPV